MSVLTNAIDSYVWNVRGTITKFIRVAAVNANDVADLDTAETAGLAAAGTQTVDYDGTLVGGTDAGLGAGTFTATISLDGTDYPISITLTGGETVTEVVTAINVDLPGTECALTAGNLVVTSPTTGNASYVVIADTDLFGGMTGYAGILEPVDGGIGGALKSVTLPNGANGYKAYLPAIEIYNTAADKTVIASDATVDHSGDISTVFDELEVEAALDALAVKVNALQNLNK